MACYQHMDHEASRSKVSLRSTATIPRLLDHQAPTAVSWFRPKQAGSSSFTASVKFSRDHIYRRRNAMGLVSTVLALWSMASNDLQKCTGQWDYKGAVKNRGCSITDMIQLITAADQLRRQSQFQIRVDAKLAFAEACNVRTSRRRRFAKRQVSRFWSLQIALMNI
jgi:hypothetical protein